jgi:hypothetical protein
MGNEVQDRVKSAVHVRAVICHRVAILWRVMNCGRPMVDRAIRLIFGILAERGGFEPPLGGLTPKTV